MINKFDIDDNRIVIGYALKRVNSSNGSMGFVQPLAEISDGQLIEITKKNFCKTLKIFITSQYEVLEQDYPSERCLNCEYAYPTSTSKVNHQTVNANIFH